MKSLILSNNTQQYLMCWLVLETADMHVIHFRIIYEIFKSDIKIFDFLANSKYYNLGSKYYILGCFGFL